MNRAPTNNEVIICDEVVFFYGLFCFLEGYAEDLTVMNHLEHKYSRFIYANILFLKINKFFKRYIHRYNYIIYRLHAFQISEYLFYPVFCIRNE